MWLRVPCESSRSAQGLECTTLHSEQCLMLEQSATWSGKHTPPHSWLALWKRNAWMRRLSGLTSPPSMLERGAESWMQSLRDFPANRTAAQGNVSETAMHAHTEKATGPLSTSSESYPSVDPPWSSSRTSQLGLLGDGFDLSARNYADWVTSSKNLSSSVQTMLAPRINGSASGSWPTSSAKDNDSSARHSTTTGVMHNGTTLTDASRNWLTPVTMSPARGGGVERKANGSVYDRTGRTFAGQAENWPTPDAHATTRDNRSVSQGAAIRPALAKLAPTWATPQAQDAKNVEQDSTAYKTLPADVLNWRTSSHPDRMMSGGPESSKSIPTSRRRLNPGFTAWLMGLPWWWTHPDVTSCVRSEMAAYRSALRSHGRRLLEGLSER